MYRITAALIPGSAHRRITEIESRSRALRYLACEKAQKNYPVTFGFTSGDSIMQIAEDQPWMNDLTGAEVPAPQ